VQCHFESRPVSRNARIDSPCTVVETEVEEHLDAEAIDPPGRARVEAQDADRLLRRARSALDAMAAKTS
jgi:hypothetical protein